MSSGYLGHIECGTKTEVGARILKNLCKALDVTPGYLLEGITTGAPATVGLSRAIPPVTNEEERTYGSDRLRVPLYMERPAEGETPIGEYLSGQIDLHELLAGKVERTIVVRVTGESMSGAGIHPGDLVIAETEREPTNGQIVVARVDGGLIVRRYLNESGTVILIGDNREHTPVIIPHGTRLDLLGVVRYSVHTQR
jgi:DNA polymerase V